MLTAENYETIHTTIICHDNISELPKSELRGECNPMSSLQLCCINI